jgi:uncharacterized protein YggT (Ycf19 family)
MQARTTPPDEPVTGEQRGVVEKEVETVRTRQRVAGAPGDVLMPTNAVAGERSGAYFETLPERLRAVGAVLLTAIEGLLAIRFLLRAFGANTNSGFVGFISDVSWPFMRPFTNIFTNRSWDQGVIEVSTIVAMGVYFLIFALIGMLVTALVPRLNGDTRRAP